VGQWDEWYGTKDVCVRKRTKSIFQQQLDILSNSIVNAGQPQGEGRNGVYAASQG
jgi:hypothetical protein